VSHREDAAPLPPLPPGTDPEVARILRDAAGPHRDVPLARQVFVNRNLRLDKIDLVGFDMDYTLAVYQLQQMERLSMEMTAARLVEAFGYPPEFLAIEYDPLFVIRGLVVDKPYGNIFKMDRHNHVGRCYRGRRALRFDDVKPLYRDEKIHLSSPRFHWIDTFFALPEACLYAEAVALLDRRGESFDPSRLFEDIRTAIDAVHADGSLKARVKQDLGRYLVRDPELGPALHKLRSGGKKLFLLTNSLWDYTDAVMRHVLDGVLPEYPSWRNYFDVIVTGAAKPAFFTEGRPFRALGPEGEPLGPPEALERGHVYEGGHLAEFERLVGIGGDRVLFVGDHIYGDILKSKRSSLWRTCMIVEELEREVAWLELNRDALAEMGRLEEFRVRLEDELAAHRSALNAVERRLERDGLSPSDRSIEEAERRKFKAELEALRRAHRDANGRIRELERGVEEGLNPHWGLTFKEGNENSRFAEQVEDYACIYTSRVSNFVNYSPMQYFRSPRASMPHERLIPRLSPWGEEHAAPAAGARPSKAAR
jgi:HAD superfamily 5'-nucleotidase-like hydrolase